MAGVVYLKKGERVPKGTRVLLIEVVSDRSQESLESDRNGVKIRVKRSGFEARLAGMLEKAEGAPMKTIYVRGLDA